MSEFTSMEWIVSPFKDAMKDIHHATDRATLYALRQVGREGIKAARSKTPVYKGPDPRAQAESGNLRRSILNARQAIHLGTGDYSLKVGPFGRRNRGTSVARHGVGVSTGTARAAAVHGITLASRKAGTSSKGQVRGVPLYRSKINEQTGFMDYGVRTMNGVAKETFESAYAKAYARYK